MSEEANLDAYLKRINYSGSIAPTLETLELLHQRHPAVIPFENLDSLMDVPVRLQLSDLVQKLIVERRGGYCFEQNLLFKAILETLGFGVEGLAARVLWNRAPGEEAPINHMVLLVDVGGVPYLADLGFGGQVATGPLRLKADLEQTTPNERYRLVAGGPDWRLETEINGEWRPVYGFDLAPQTMDDFVALNDAAMLEMRDFLRAARVEGPKRYALRGARFRIHEKGETTTRMLTSTSEMRDVLTGTFGIQLPATDKLEPALEKELLRRDGA
ncbi:MAG: arylamine N-acetyltransferase [Devosia sp.]